MRGSSLQRSVRILLAMGYLSLAAWLLASHSVAVAWRTWSNVFAYLAR